MAPLTRSIAAQSRLSGRRWGVTVTSKRTSMKCIYGCGRDATSQEHPLPAAFGSFKNYPALNDRVCADCNGKCKILDEQVSRGGGEGLFRMLLGIRGRKGNKKVNPFYQGSAGASRLTMTGKPLNGQAGSALGIDDIDAGAFGELRQVLFIFKDGTSIGIPLTADTPPARFKALTSGIDLSQVEQVHLYADIEEIEPIGRMLQQVWPKFYLGDATAPREAATYGNVIVDFTVTERYFRGLAKIGFHYFLSQISRYTGAEDIFRDIREFIMSEGPLERVDNFVRRYNGQLLPELQMGLKPSKWFHLTTAEVDEYDLSSRIQLFMGPEYLAPIWRIQLAKNPSPIKWDEFYTSLYRYYERADRTQYDGEVQTRRVTRSGACTLRNCTPAIRPG